MFTRKARFVACVVLTACSPTTPSAPPAAAPTFAAAFDKVQVDVACGKCLFGMDGDDCELAFRVGGQSWYVDGVDSEALGDPHAADGMCNAVTTAVVSGEVAQGRFVATKFELEPSAAR